MTKKCSEINPMEFPMYPRCASNSLTAALKNEKTAEEANIAMKTYTIKTLKANNDLLEAQRELAATLKKLLEKHKINW
jgi:ribosome-associated translation inhibitor RaiA